MSHFTTIVFSKTGTELEIELLMAPYHEFECTGINDEYVQDVDITEKALKAYNTRTTEVVVFPDGSFKSKYDEEFYTRSTELLYNYVFTLPENCVLETRPTKDVKSFVDFIKEWYGTKLVPYGQELDISGDHKYGFTLLDPEGNVVKVVKRTNLNDHWDWYQIGGRWCGYFKPKRNTTSGYSGSKSWATKEGDYDPTYVDSIKIKDIDMEGMREQAKKEANETWDDLEKILKGRELPSWNEIRKQYGDDLNAARSFYHDIPVVKELNQHEKFRWSLGDLKETYGPDRESYIQQKVDSILVPFSFVDENGWHERGNMGWWGAVSDEKDKQTWVQTFMDVFNNADPESYVTVVDCHI